MDGLVKAIYCCEKTICKGGGIYLSCVLLAQLIEFILMDLFLNLSNVIGKSFLIPSPQWFNHLSISLPDCFVRGND